jgi:hypothetical protein
MANWISIAGTLVNLDNVAQVSLLITTLQRAQGPVQRGQVILTTITGATLPLGQPASLDAANDLFATIEIALISSAVVIYSITPSPHPASDSTTWTITGKNFDTAPGSAQIQMFGGSQTLLSVTATVITIAYNGGDAPPGTYDVQYDDNNAASYKLAGGLVLT